MSTEGYEIEFFVDVDGQYRWRVTAGNGKTVATSGEGYHNEDECVAMAEKLFPSFPKVWEYEREES